MLFRFSKKIFAIFTFPLPTNIEEVFVFFSFFCNFQLILSTNIVRIFFFVLLFFKKIFAIFTFPLSTNIKIVFVCFFSLKNICNFHLESKLQIPRHFYFCGQFFSRALLTRKRQSQMTFISGNALPLLSQI